MDDVWVPAKDEVVGGRHKLLSPLSKGGMAQVWRAHDSVTGTTVAIKFLRFDTEELLRLGSRERDDEIAVLYKRFQREADLLQRLSHPRICAYLDYGYHRRAPYLAMELVSGDSLRTFLDENNTVPLATAVAIAARIADALVAMHALPVAHRDLKPDNVMVSDEGQVTIIDFGIARPLHSGATRYTSRGSTVGSRGYQAPEQIKELEPTAKTDIYAFGCILYELLAGRLPFPLGMGSGLVENHLLHMPLPPSTFNRGVPGPLDTVVLWMLAKEQQDRPTAEQVRAALDPYTPRLGDPAPNPCTRPDPTASFRAPQPASGMPRPVAMPQPSVPVVSQEWLDRDAVERLCATAETEIGRAEPATAVLALKGMAARVRGEWGSRRPLVRRVWTLTADGMRLVGELAQAAERYQEVLEKLVHGEGPAERAERAVLRLRTAQCRLVFGEVEAAIAVVTAAGHTAAGLPSELAVRVEKVRQEVADAVAEHVADAPAEE